MNLKRLVFALFLAAASSAAMAQTVSKDSIYLLVDAVPELPGGKEALNIFLKTYLRMPKEAKDAGVGGHTILEYVVEPDGKITGLKVAVSAKTRYPDDAYQQQLAGLLDAEALRVARLLPQFRPATLRNQAVRFRMRLPVVFTLP